MNEFKSFKEEIDYWTGYLLIKIGEGDFRGGVNLMLMQTRNEAFERGYKKAKDEKVNG